MYKEKWESIPDPTATVENLKKTKELKETIIKKNYDLNIGSIRGSKDVIFNLKKGEVLPKEIPEQFKKSLLSKDII